MRKWTKTEVKHLSKEFREEIEELNQRLPNQKFTLKDLQKTQKSIQDKLNNGYALRYLDLRKIKDPGIKHIIQENRNLYHIMLRFMQQHGTYNKEKGVYEWKIKNT